MNERSKRKLNGITLAVVSILGFLLLLWPTTLTYDASGSPSADPDPVKIKCVWRQYEATDATPPIRSHEHQAYDGPSDEISASGERIRADCALAKLQKRQWLFIPTIVLTLGLMLLLVPQGSMRQDSERD
ncbi:hypothetical protein ACIA03_08450 [Nocardioides sp. NPDC051685]|uniref:hypothetical protein n=1 Tax=Nocardioides sp. NPDC051685 TaxID=3364334 RepID=UPI00378FBBA8